MANFTYIIGAGASCGIRNEKNKESWEVTGLPLVSEIPKRFLSLIEAFGEEGLNMLRDKIYVNLVELNSEIQDFISVDTLARSCFLSGNYGKLTMVKKAIEIFILYEEITRGIDKRYDLFFSTLLDRKDNTIFFPDKINIISWNFDIQIERSITRLTNLPINFIKKIAGFYYENVRQEIKDFTVFKLNGTCWREGVQKIDFKNKENAIRSLIEYYSDFTANLSSNIRFAWEGDESVIMAAYQLLKDSDTLVVIGYSFPTFNRQVDKKLLTSFFTGNMNLKNIYIQVPEEGFQGVEERIKSLFPHSKEIKDKIFFPIKGLNEFYIPPNYHDD